MTFVFNGNVSVVSGFFQYFYTFGNVYVTVSDRACTEEVSSARSDMTLWGDTRLCFVGLYVKVYSFFL